MDLIVLLSQVEKSIGHLLFLFTTRLPGRDKVVWLKKGRCLSVDGSNIETVLVEHDGLALHRGFPRLLYINTYHQIEFALIDKTYTLLSLNLAHML